MNTPDYDALARLLDGDLPQGEATAEARALSAVAKTLEAAAIQPRMEHKAELRMALIEAARQQATAPTFLGRLRSSFDDSTRRVRYSMRMAAASGAAAMALSSGGVALAAHRALPSDPFYGVKLAYEDVRLTFIGDPVARGQQMLAYAELRMVEAKLAAEDGDMEGARRALAEADASSRGAARHIISASQERGDPTLLAILDDFARKHRRALTALMPTLTGDAAAAAEDALVVLRRISQRVVVLSGPCTRCDRETAKSETAERRNRSRDTTGPDAVAAADPEFDFADIPPASEPFAPCPCTTAPGASKRDTGTASRVKSGAKKKATSTGAGAVAPSGEPAAGGETNPGDTDPPVEPEPEPEPKPKPKPKPEPKPEPPPEDEEVRPELPAPAEEPVDEVEDEIDDVVDEVLDNLPTPPPGVPTPPKLLP